MTNQTGTSDLHSLPMMNSQKLHDSNSKEKNKIKKSFFLQLKRKKKKKKKESN
jgi:hypothetical protein